MKKNLKKLGAVTAALAIPVATVISCGNNNGSKQEKKITTPIKKPIKPSKEDLTKKANEIKSKNVDSIKELFASARFINQGNKKLDVLVQEINSIQEIDKKIKVISDATSISFLNTKNGTDITNVILTAKADGIVTALITTNTSNATNPNVKIMVTITGTTDKEIDKKISIENANATQIKNLSELESRLNATLLKQSNIKSSEIANKINGINDIKLKLQALKDAAGIALEENYRGTIITNVILAPKPNGTITVIISTDTLDATTSSKNIFGVIKGKADKDLKVEESAKPKTNDDKLQKINILNIEKEIQNKLLINQGNKKVSEIAKEIEAIADLDTKIKAINKIAGSKLTKENHGTTITNISLTTKADGTIIVIISTNTPNTTLGVLDISGTIKGMSDQEIDSKKLKNDVDGAQKVNLDAINNQFNNVKLINQGNRKTSEVVNKVNGMAKLDDKFKAIEKEMGVKLQKDNNGTMITNVILASTPNGEVIILISTETKKATDENKDLTIKVSSISDSKIDVKLANEKADKDILINVKTIEDLFSGSEIIDQKDKKVKTIVDEVNAMASVELKLGAINKITNVKLPKINNGTEIKDIILTADSKTGKITLTISTFTKNATTTDKEIKVEVKAKSDAIIDAEITKAKANAAKLKNNKKLENLLSNIKLINQGDRKVSEIVDSINALKTIEKKLELIKTEMGIDLPKDNNSTIIKSVSLTSMANGAIAIILETITPGADKEEQKITGVIKGLPDAEIIMNIANKKQVANITLINQELKKIKLLNQDTKKTSEIKKIINDITDLDAKLKAIKSILNIDLKKSNDTTEIANITIASKVDGTISISIKTHTSNAKTPISIVELSVKGKSDADIAKELIVPANNFPYDVKTTSKWTKLPKDFDFSRISHIPDGAFKNLKELPDNFDFSKVTSIGEEAFQKLAAIPIKKNAFANVKTIGARAFVNVMQLPNGNMFTNVETIGDGAFYELRSLPSDTNFKKLTTLGMGTFHQMRYLSIGTKFPELKTIGMGAFGMLEHWTKGIEMPKIETIGDDAFYHLKETPVGMDFSNVTMVGSGAFYSLGSLPPGTNFSKVKKIDFDAFHNLTTLPFGVRFLELESIGNEAFYSLEFMQEKTAFPKLRTINYKAFHSLLALPKGMKLKSLETIGVGAFGRITELPKGIDFSNLTTIGDGAFFGLTALPQGMNLSNVTSIGIGSFGSVTSLPQGIKLDKANLEELVKAFMKIDRKALEAIKTK